MSDPITLPVALATGLVLQGLTAPAMRLSLVLIASASSSGRIDVLKPQLERRAGVRLDNADRTLNRPRGATIAVGEYEAPAFAELDYQAGIQKRLAGIVRGQLSPELIGEIAHPRHGGRTITVDGEELRRLDSVPGILLWLRLALDRQRGDDRVRIHLTDEDAAAIFGGYVQRAAITRTTADGETFRATSLSRIYDDLVAPAVRDLWGIEGYVVDAAPIVPVVRQRGRAWSSIEITMTKTRKRLSLRELAALGRDADEYELRKHANSDPSKMRSNGSPKSKRGGANVPSNEGAS